MIVISEDGRRRGAGRADVGSGNHVMPVQLKQKKLWKWTDGYIPEHIVYNNTKKTYRMFTRLFIEYQEARVIQLGVPSNRTARYLSLSVGCWVLTPGCTVVHCPSSSNSQTCNVSSDRFLWMYRIPGSSSGTGSGGLGRSSYEAVAIQMVFPWL